MPTPWPPPTPCPPLGLTELRSRAEALTTWKLALGRGVLPEAREVEWPQEPFKSKFIVRGRGPGSCALRRCTPCKPSSAAFQASGLLGTQLRSRGSDGTTKLASKHGTDLSSEVGPQTDALPGSKQPLRQDALSKLEMARFTRRYPAVLETLMKQMLMLVKVGARWLGSV
jgi:hypothetical protein